MDECILYFGGERQCSLVKEISKMFEKHYRGTLFSVNEELKILTKIQGEWVMVMEGKK